MDVLEVYKKIEDENVQTFSFGISGVKGLTICANSAYGVFINDKEINDSDEEFCVVAHEYGHCATGTLHRLNSDKSYVSQCEYRADRKSIIEFLPVGRIKNAIKNGCQTAYEISEFLDLPENFIIKAFNHYKAMGKL